MYETKSKIRRLPLTTKHLSITDESDDVMMSKFKRDCKAFLVTKIEVHVSSLFKVPDTRHKGSVHLWRSGGTVSTSVP